MFEPKIPAVAASIGFVLSLLIGVMSGAAFGIVLARAAVLAILFGGLTLIGKILIVKYLPELLQGDGPENASSSDSGNMVDITVGEGGNDENPFSTPADGVRMVPDFLERSERQVKNGFSTMSEPGEDDFQDEIPSSVNQTGSEPVRRETDGSNQNQPRSSGGLDVLPDLQDFIPQVSASVSSEDDENSTVFEGTGMSQSLFSESDNSGSTVESETMAKAIRTILAKDN